MATISVTVPTVTEYTVTPSRTSPTTFFADRETRLSEEATRIPEQNTQATALNTFKTQANAVRDEVNGFKTAAETAQGLAETAQAAAELAETGAAESATASSDSADASEVSRLAAEAILDNFDDRYLGAKASDPTLDNDGNALQSGALYYNTTSDEMKVYDLTLTTWISISYVPTTLTSLSDTNLSTPSNGQVLSYDFGTSKWVNTTPTSVTVNNTLTSTSTTEALSANMGKTLEDSKQATLVSGTNIRTINSTSLVGSGNIVTPDTITTVNNTLTSTSTTEALSANMGKTLKDAQDLKAPAANPIFTGLITEQVSVSTLTLGATSSVQTYTATGNFTIVDDLASGEFVTFVLTNATFLPTYPTMTWWGDVEPTLGSIDKLFFEKIGATLYGTHVGSIA